MSDFEAGSSTTFPSPLAAGRMVVGDFDGDGDTDILYQTGGGGTAFQYAQSNGDGTFAIAVLASSPFAGLTLPDNGGGTHYAADFDGDGDIDLLAGVAGATGSYFSNNGDGTFSSLSTTTFPAPLAAGRRVVGDFDGDGDADILYQTGADGTVFEYARSNGDGTFAIVGVGLSPFAGVTLPNHNGSNYRAGDFDGDGDIDLMAGVNSTTGFYFSNNGDGTFSSLSTATFPLPAAGSRQTAGDFDSDGDLDILYQTGGNGTPFQYARNNGNNTFTLLGLATSPFASLPLPDHTGGNYYAADFDGDGDTDLLAGTNGTSGTYYYQVGEPPEIVSSTPTDNATGILVGANIQVVFDESVTKGSGNIYVVRTSDNVVIETIAVGSAQVTGSGTNWTIDLSVTLAGSTAYAIRFDAGTFVDTDSAIFQGIDDNFTLNFITAAVNTAPVVDLDGASPGSGNAISYTENATPQQLAPAGTVIDADSLNFDTGQLTVSFTAGGSADDRLTVIHQGTGAGEIGISGSAVYYGGVAFATFTGGTGTTALVFTFDPDATPTVVQALMRQIGFSNASDTPSTTARTVQFVVTDGDGGTGSAQVLVDVTAADDAPTVLIGTAGPATEQVALDLKNLIGVDDVDTSGDVTVTLTVNWGSLSVEAGTSGVDVNELFPDEVILTGTIAELQALLGSDPTSVVSYTADTDYPPPDDALTVTIDDGTSSVSETATIAVTAVNDAPELDLDFFGPGDGAALIWTEGDGPQLLAPFALFDDDNDDHDGATLTVTINGATAGDQLAIDSVGTGLGELSISGANLLYEGQVVGTWSGGANGAPLLITFNADACYCSIELAMASILYENSDDLTATALRTVDFTFVDGDGAANGGSDTTTASVDLTVFPFAEVIAGPDAAGNEDATIALTGVAIDGVANDPAVDVIAVELGVANGTLTIRTDVAGGLAAADVVGNGSTSLVLTGTQVAINATLAAANGLAYQGAPDFFGSDTLSIDAQGAPVVGSFDFSNVLELDVGSPIELLEMYDFDGDGTSDLLIGIEDGLGVFGSVMFDIGLPDPGFPTGFAIADFDGDGLVDIAVSVDAAPSGYLAFLSSDAGAMVKIADIAFAYDVVTGDFNGDGLADLAVADGDNSRVAIVLQTAPGMFAPVSYTTATTSVVGMLAVGDFNGDNVLDMLVSNASELPGPVSPGSIDLLLGNGDGTFQAAVEVLTTPASPGEIVVADFDGDSALDFAFASTNYGGTGTNGAVVVLGDGDGTFATPVGYDTTPDGEPYELVAADFNGDGVLDLAVANFNDPASFSVLVGIGDGSFEPPLEFATIDPPFVIAAGDPDDDGDTDIVVGSLDGWIDGYNNDVLPGRSADATKDIAVTGVNDAPTAASLAGDSVTLNFGDTAVLLDGGTAATIGDIDSTDFAGGSLTLAITGGDPSQDLLVIANEGVGVGQIGVAGASVTYGGVTIGTAAGGLGGAALVVSFNANATAQAIEALAHAMTYANSGGADPTPGTRTINWTLVDGDGTANGGADTLALATSVLVLNADPAIDLNGTDPGTANAISYTEGAPLTAIAPNATVSDPGSIDLGGGRLTVALTANGDVDDALALTGLGYGVGQFSIEDIDLYYNFGNPVGPELIGSIIGGAGGTALVIAFNSLVTPAVVEALVRAVGFVNFWTSPGNPQRSVTFTLSNGAGEVSIPVVATIDVTDISDPAVANDDVFRLVENEVRLGNLFADNGNGNDFDPDGEPIQVIEVNGTAALVGTTVTLASGALLTVNANGSFIYNPNGAFSSLVPAESGAANTAVNDSFSYTITGGATATASVTQNGVVSVGDIYKGDAGGNAITGAGYADYFDASQGGDDYLAGMAGNDGFYFGAAFTGADTVDGGAGDNDQIGLRGDYTGANALVLGAGTMIGVEVLALLSGYDYDVTTADGNVPNGGTLMVFAGNLGVGDNLTFNGSAETNGAFKVYGGKGTDRITTGAGEDGIYFGPGKFDPLFDRVDGGTGVNDQFVLDGDYAITLDGTAIRNIDMIALLKGVAGDLADYDLTLDASLIGLGEKITVWGTTLETALAVDGSAVAGDLKIWGGTLGDTLTGGAGDDWIWGGAGADLMAGGDGADTFGYDFAAQSRAFGFDRISGFEVGDDTIDLPFAVAGFATAQSGALDAVTMDSMLEIAVTGLTTHQAAVFTATGGDLNGRTFLLVDANGTTGYQASGDFLIELVTPVGTIDQLGMFA